MRPKMLVTCLAFVGFGLVGGCGEAERAADCEPVRNEAQVLEEYVNDPVLDLVPPGARRSDVGVQRSTACQVVETDTGSDGVSQTSVELGLTTDRPFDTAQLLDVYDAAATRTGWRRISPAVTPPPDRDPAALRYCRSVLGATSYLTITSSAPVGAAEVRGPGGVTVSPQATMRVLPGPIFVRIVAAPTEQSCPV